MCSSDLKTSPKLVETLTPAMLPLSIIVKVLQQLLEERVPIIDMRSIAETLVEAATKSKEPDSLTSAVRVALKRLIIQTIQGNTDTLTVMTLSPDLEQILQQSLQVMTENGVGLEPSLADKLHKALSNFEQQQSTKNESAILLSSPQVRGLLTKFVRYSIPRLHVLSYQEIPDDKQVKIIGAIGQS